MSPKISDIEKRKAEVRARAAKVAQATAKNPANDYGAYVESMKAQDKKALSKVEWAEMLVKSSKERKAGIGGTPQAGNSAGTPPGVSASKATRDNARKAGLPVKDDVAQAADARREKAKEDKAQAAKVEGATSNAAAKKAKDPNVLTVSDVARELNIEPKVARARLRRVGWNGNNRATEGRWPTVAKDGPEHKALKALLVKAGEDDDGGEAEERVRAKSKMDDA